VIRLGQSFDNSLWIGWIVYSDSCQLDSICWEEKTDLFDDFGMTTDSRDRVGSFLEGLDVRGVGIEVDRFIKT
jgi:hypothetical protein